MVNGKKDRNLTTGSIALGLLWFAVPMILGNLLQQFYNIADALIVGQFLGAKALAAVGSAYTLMVFLTSVLLGLCMGSGAIFSLQYGAGDREALKRSTFVSLVLIGFVTLVLNVSVFVWIDPILRLLHVPENVYPLMRDYLWVIFWGIGCIVLKKVYSKLSKPMSELNLPSVRRRYYPVKTKLSAVRDRVINEMGYAEVLSKYEVKPSTFHVWLHKYKSRVLSEEQHKRLSSRNYKMLYPMTDQERAELETLRQEVEKQKILVEAYELMLELARERLHVDVKKNYEEMLLAGLSRDRKNGEVKP